MANQESRSFRTGDAARYLASRGTPTSKSKLEKLRARGAEDPRGVGPDFYRDPRGICWYGCDALDRYAAEQLSARRLRAPLPQPTNFRGRRRGANRAA
jgi:hypothetical protein